jgi:hypothetical protein
MTKTEFRDWLQTQLAESGCHEEQGDLWRDIESEGLLPEGVVLAADHVAHDFIFRLEDGLLASRFETGCEGETVWFFVENDVDDNLRDYSVGEAEAALRGARLAASELGAMLGETTPPDGWCGAAAYGDRDYGEGHTRLFARAYDHQPTEAEIRHDAFIAANPNWQSDYLHYTLHAACYDWEGTLEEALSIAIVPAVPVEGPPTARPVSSPAGEA